ncbi:MAG: hypothetical protein ACQEQH_03140 [Bacillota bacterium]
MFIIIIILIIGLMLGDLTDEGNQTEENQTTKRDVDIDYEITSQKDMIFENENNDNIVRYGFNVVIHEQVSTEDLKAISKEIVELEKGYSDINAFNAIAINFYDYEDFTSGISSVPPLGIVEYAPNGEWSEADTVNSGDYESMEYSWELKEKDWDNQLTEEEIEIYSYMQDEYEVGVTNEEEIYQNVSDLHDISIETVKEVYDKAMNWIHQ